MTSKRVPKRAIRIGGASGGFTDRVSAISRLASDPTIDAIVGDWLSENVMTGYAVGKEAQKKAELSRGTPFCFTEKLADAHFASTFMQCFLRGLPALRANGAKLVVNAGASDTELLAEVVRRACKDADWNAKVAWVEGDEVTDVFMEMVASGHVFRNSCDGKTLTEWGHEPVSAQAYLGSLGIAEALRCGANIVICGRVSDAAPTIGLSVWWHNWSAEAYDALAGALIAGHLIECSAFITGGYWSGFKTLLAEGKHLNLGFPVAEVEDSGICVITKESNTNGVVNIETVTSQLVYEISGPLYFNSDVVASLSSATLTTISSNRVRISGITGLPPPPTTRVGVTANGGFQAEWHFYLVGLDMREKVQWMEQQARYAIGKDLLSQFTCLEFTLLGYTGEGVGVGNQDGNTADMRIFAQSKIKEAFEGEEGFARKIYETVLQSCPGVSRPNDNRLATPKPYFEYFPTLIPQSACRHRVHLLFSPPSTPSSPLPSPITIALPPLTRDYGPQSSYETANPVPLEDFGPTTMAPLGYVALARSGDKASDANVGIFVRQDDEWEWLRSFLTIDVFRRLVGEESSKKNIERFEILNLKVVHFLVKDHLDRGYNSGSGVDTLAKNLGEWVRCRRVEVPNRFLDRRRV